VPLTAEETDREQWWVLEVGHHPHKEDQPCHSCTTQGKRSSGTRQGWCCKRNLERADVQEETSSATRMQQRHKKPMPKCDYVWEAEEHVTLQADCRAGDGKANSQDSH
jgi:hypothetical protein